MGNEIFKTVTQATGLPTDLVRKELADVLSAKGIARDDVTLDDLRIVLAEYMRKVILDAKEEFDGGILMEEEVSPEDFGRE